MLKNFAVNYVCCFGGFGENENVSRRTYTQAGDVELSVRKTFGLEAETYRL